MAYNVAVGKDWVSRSDFWTMPPQEFWWLMQAKLPDLFKRQEDMGDLLAMLREAKEAEKNG